jgi:Leucine-rich repeat (LRR) protein
MARDLKAGAGTIVHMHPYHYSLIHHSLGVPLTSMQPPLYHLDVDHRNDDAHLLTETGITGTKINQTVRDSGRGHVGNDSLVTEPLLLRLTECDSLSEIRVISLRNQQLTGCLKILSKCENLEIAYLQGNFLQEKDLLYLQTFQNLKKIDLSDNSLISLPPGNVLQGLTHLKFLYLHNNNIQNWTDVQSLTQLPSIMHITLFGNPVCSIPGFRHFLVNSI